MHAATERLGWLSACSPTRAGPKLKWGSASSAANSQLRQPHRVASEHPICPSSTPIAPYRTAPYRNFGACIHGGAAHCRGAAVFWLAPFMSWTKLIGLMYSRYLQYSVACMAPPPCPCPACAPCTDRQGQAHHGGSRAGRLVALSFGTSLGAQFNFSRDTSAVPLSLLHRPRGASKAKRTERKLQHHQFFNLVCRLAAISRDPARIPWFAPASSNPPQRVRPAVAQQPSNPLYCLPEAPSAPGTTGTWLPASISVAACLRLPHAHRCELRQRFASAESPSQRLDGATRQLVRRPRG